MKKIICLFLIVLFNIFFANVKAMTNLDLGIESKNGILYNVTDNMILYNKGMNDRIKIASMTKVMTAIVALENINNLDDSVLITQDDYKNVYKENLTVVGFNIGDTVTYRDLLYGLLFKSGADCAYALADNVAGSEEQFVKLMNDKAMDLKLKNTYFTNTVGYDEENNYSSVYDVAIILKYALENENFKRIISDDIYTTSNDQFILKNVIDEAIDKVGINSPYSDYILGGKTGYTKEARNCLVSYAIYNDTMFIVVVANASTYNPIKDTVNLYTEAFNNYSRKMIVNQNDYLVSLSYKEDEVKVYADDDVDLLMPNDANIKDVSIEYTGHNITNNSKLDDKLGSVNLEYKGEVVKTIDIVFNNKIKNSVNYRFVKPTTKSNNVRIIFISLITIVSVVIVFFLLIFISMFIDVKKNKRRWRF